ncbi:hypothetical protein [uncultured Maribacter sp.]|uniref:hypothetical protein n=1 Tax=uncultured Maribacter sp. TaxID=431308 RepID=UPI002633D0E0|nr:hypothetical protein [uncultured Maribacter sp.]
MSLEKFAKDLERFDFKTKVVKDSIEIDYNEIKFEVNVDEAWLKAIKKVYRAKQYELNEESKFQVSNQEVEFQVFKLTPSFVYKPLYEFKDKKENTVILTNMSKEYKLNLFRFSDFNSERIKNRVTRRYNDRSEGMRKRRPRFLFRFDDLFLNYITVKYQPNSKLQREKLIEIGREKCKSCLFKLAVIENESWELRETVKAKGFNIPIPEDGENDFSIPKSNYEDDLVGFYKVAKSSIFPTQSFLSYYHILEYNFLKVSDEELFNKTKGVINSTTFNASYDNVNRLLSILQKHERNLDETSMLKRVLTKFIDEEEFIQFIIEIENNAKEKIFSKPKEPIFGERIPLKLEEGHAISNVSKIIKHIRNSLVHSSDKYTREECVIPFSESESIVIKYIPILKFLAEKVIYANAK